MTNPPPATPGQVTGFGISDIALAGQADCIKAGSDSAPLNSPVEAGLVLRAGQAVQVSATGSVISGTVATAGIQPNGVNYNVTTDAAFGLSGIRGPVGSLVGVFLDDSTPKAQNPPQMPDFSTAGARDQAESRPELREIFYIGSGKTTTGAIKRFIIPSGATRLFLGVLDQMGRNSFNTGSFQAIFLNPPPIVVPPPPPPNDDFANRTKLIGDNFVIDISNTNATNEVREPVHAGRAGGKSLWWSWTASQTNTVTISTAASSVDTLLAVYTGSSLASLVPVASNDDDPNGGSTSLVRFSPVAGTEYQIAVDSFGGAEGSIKLTLTVAPLIRVERSGQNIILSWPANAQGFSLESSGSLTAGSWTPVTLSPVLSGDSFSVKIPISGEPKFYRLRGP
ncbi:MAG: PPC domain-containing protein [Verrucomicrobia bacterium]|nr:PPC domain-containing protein [Verrucomicrobiota bacterium]